MKKMLVVAAALAVVAAVLIFALPLEKQGTPFRLIYSARNWGYLLPIEESYGGRWLGGFDRRATVVKEAVKQPRSFVVDSGGFFADFRLGTLAYREVLAGFTLKGMARTQVEVANVDLMDQMWGRETLTEYLSTVSFPFVSASLVDAATGEYLLEPFKVFERDGLKVAFVGVVETGPIGIRATKEAVADIQLLPGMVRPDYADLPKEGEGITVLTPFEAIRRVAPLVKGKADVVVVLGAGGHEIWQALSPFKDGKTFHIALCVTGKAMPGPLMQGNVPIYMTGVCGTYVGVLDVVYVEDGTVRCTEWNPVELTRDVESDPELAGLVTEMRKSLKDVDPMLLVDKIYGPSNDAKYVGAQACAQCHQKEYETWSQGPHAHALDSLKAKSAQYDPKCLVCHVSDYQAVDGYVSEEATPKMTPINCELCHGRGSVHVEMKGTGADAALVNPDPPRCIICHDYINDPEFDYATDWPKIQHGRNREPVGEAKPSGKGYHP